MNEPVVVDGNLISSRTPRDLAPFGAAMVKFLDANIDERVRLSKQAVVGIKFADYFLAVIFLIEFFAVVLLNFPPWIIRNHPS